MTNKIKMIAFKVDVDYGYDYEKDVALAFMYKVEGIIALANRLSEECADG